MANNRLLQTYTSLVYYYMHTKATCTATFVAVHVALDSALSRITRLWAMNYEQDIIMINVPVITVLAKMIPGENGDSAI